MMISKRIKTMDDWIDMFYSWQDDIGLKLPEMEKFRFEPLYDSDEAIGREIEFGEFAGNNRWNSVLEVPTQNIRDSLLQLIYVQGDTEFASVEQQNKLLTTVHNEYDRYALIRIMMEEMRHGLQMCDILVRYFGESGKVEARKLLERRAREAFPDNKNGARLLGSFNESVSNWVDFYTYTCFVDRDGKYQLTMLAPSAFAPLAKSAGPMLREEAFHMASGQDGLRRIIEARKVPAPMLQKYLNKWISTAHDLFGKDESSTAEWGYVWGLKGRFDERDQADKTAFNRKEINDHNRNLYHKEVSEIIDNMNGWLDKAGNPDGFKFRCPDIKFRRSIGRYADGMYDIEGNEFTERAKYDAYLADNLPGEKEDAILLDLSNDGPYLADRKLPTNAWEFKYPPLTR